MNVLPEDRRQRSWTEEYIRTMVTRICFEALDMSFVPQGAFEKAENILMEIIAERDGRSRKAA